MTESELLNRYARHRDAEAFSLLVERYQQLIFATCRRRLHHATDVDDAVQETFLRMAKAAGSIKSNVGGWLHRCASNVSTDLNRRRQTRTQHESRALPAAGSEQQELAELREHLDAALEKLDSNERELIVQRFFAGRTQVELAGQIGVAPSTISLRLSNAIDHLRDHLKTAGYAVAAAALVIGLEKEAASAAVPPDLTAKISRVGLSGVIAAAVGFSSAWPIAILLICIGVISAVAVYFSKSGAPRFEPQAAAIQPATAPVALTVESGKTQVGAQPKWLPANAAPVITGVLTGQIVDRAGDPVVGALVELVGPQGGRAETDENGEYAFKARDIGDGNYEVGVTADGFQTIDYWTGANPRVSISAATPSVRNFVLDRGVVVNIVVRTSNGKPLVNSSVQATPTDSQARNRFREETTDEKGECQITLPPSKTPYQFEAICTGYAQAHQEVVCDTVDEPQYVDIVLESGITVTGTAICSDGKPATGWGIAAAPSWSRINRFHEASHIDANGNFSLQHLTAGKYQLNIDRHGEQRSLGEFVLPPDGKTPLYLNIPGPGPGGLFTLSGKLFCNGPLNDGMSVEVHGTGANAGFSYMNLAHTSGQWTAEEKKNGAPFSVADVPAGTYNLRFECTDIGSVDVKNVTVPGDPITVNLKIIRKPHLTGTVTDPSGTPVARFALRVRKVMELGGGPNYGQDENWIQIDDPNGHFDIELVAPGVYQAQAAAPGYAWTWSAEARAEKSGDVADTTIRLTGGGALHGTIVDAAGHAVPGAKVIPLSMSAAISMSYPRGGFAGDAGAVLTDAQGHFALNHLSPGDESLKITLPNFAPLMISKLKIVDGQTTTAPPATIHTGGTIEGIVYDARGNVAANAVINLQDDPYYHYDDTEMAAHLLATATTDAAGHFRIDHLPIDQNIIVEKPYGNGGQGGVVRRTVHLTDGQTQTVDMGGTTPIHGRLIINSKPAAVTALTLAVDDLNVGSTLIRCQTDADAKFTFFGPPPGSYTLYCPNDNSPNRDMVLGDFKITSPPHDIGDVSVEFGKLVIHVQPGDAANINDIELEKRDETEWSKKLICSANADPKDPATWICGVVPAGRLMITVSLAGPGYRRYSVPFERTAGTVETSINLPPIPAATAIFTVGSKPTVGNAVPGTEFRSEDGRYHVALSTDPAAGREVPVPPGNYYVIDNRTDEPVKNVAPIKAVAGQKTAIDLDALAAVEAEQSQSPARR